MNLHAILLLLAAVTSVPSVHADAPPDVHATTVADVHYPSTSARGEPIPVQVTLVNGTNASEVRLIYCRVQHYACGPVVAMAPVGIDQHETAIPWTNRFFRDVTTVGIRIEIEGPDGNLTRSPLRHHPARPADLPADADTYYYLSLPRESSSTDPFIALLLLGLVGVWRR